MKQKIFLTLLINEFISCEMMYKIILMSKNIYLYRRSVYFACIHIHSTVQFSRFQNTQCKNVFDFYDKVLLSTHDSEGRHSGWVFWSSVCPLLVKVFCLLISQLVFIGLLLYFTYRFLKTLAIHSQGIVNKIIFYGKFRHFILRIFYKFWCFEIIG